MKSIIDDIFFGSCAKSEDFNYSDEYWELSSRNDEICQILYKNLTDEQISLVNEMFLNCTGAEREVARTKFAEGFKLGFLVAAECFSNK